MDALNSWQLVKELKEATGLPAAASFKHVSPAGAAVGLPLSETWNGAFTLWTRRRELSPIACAYIRARGADRLCSYGDWAALSDVCDAATARLPEAARSPTASSPRAIPTEALEILKTKKKGGYNVVADRPGLRSRRHGAQGRLRHHLRAGAQQLRDRRGAAAKHRHREQRPARAAPSAT